MRKACYGVVRFIMESGAKGCEVVVSGKLRGQRAKSMKFTDGFMIHSGYPIEEYIDMAVRHVYLRQGDKLFLSLDFLDSFCTMIYLDHTGIHTDKCLYLFMVKLKVM